MSKTMKVPQVGESISEVTIAQWLKKEGEKVELDEIICELESDKATFEVPAEAAGILRIIAQEGDTIEVGAEICKIDTDGAEESGANTKQIEQDKKPGISPENSKREENSSPSDNKKKKGSDKLVEMFVPAVGESITEVTIGSWLKSDGDNVMLDEAIAEIESDK